MFPILLMSAFKLIDKLRNVRDFFVQGFFEKSVSFSRGHSADVGRHEALSNFGDVRDFSHKICREQSLMTMLCDSHTIQVIHLPLKQQL